MSSPELDRRELDGVVTEPLSAVLGLDRHISTIGIVLGLVGGVALHAGAAAKGLRTPFWVDDFATSVARAVDGAAVEEIDIVMDEAKPEPAPEPEPEPEAEPEAPPPDTPPPPAQAAPAAAAQAGRVLEAAPAAGDAVEDMTDFTMVQGDGDRFAGGTTAAHGTSKEAVRNPVVGKDGVKDGKGKQPDAKPLPPPPPKENKARAAAAKGTNWSSCGFPAQADMEQIDFARVRLSVTVDPRGKATSVQVLSDPGNGFGSLARQCAFRMTYRTALGPDGQPITASTPPFTVTFTR
ncbi:MAG: hypothetical protein KIT72_14880 [Polyangiaceae bacterium]|nr:hypothetical protein [Polyangiaceae bacterium]MCW5791700.1 hypothetical protein [Polyangiaceae bacterium]